MDKAQTANESQKIESADRADEAQTADKPQRTEYANGVNNLGIDIVDISQKMQTERTSHRKR